MSQVVEAVYEGGRLRPLQPLHLNEGDHVRLEVEVPQRDDLAKLEALDSVLSACSEMTDEQWKIFNETTERRPFFRRSTPS